MNNNSSDIYPKIASYITSRLPSGWASAWVNVTLEPESVLSSGRYLLPDQTAEKNFPTDWDLSQLFLQLSKTMTPVWTSAKFTLTPDGKFKTDFVY